MNAPVPVAAQTPSLALQEQELIGVLESSLYPGAKAESIKLVIGYCRAAQLDPMLKPVHIVPMRVKQKKRDGAGFDWVWRDVIMPGIELYRIKADRTGQYLGLSEPTFGPEQVIAGVKYPQWCKITARRLVGNRTAEFPATVYWLESYATEGKDDQGNDSQAPNRMWRKRPYGQLEKCAEALALRRAFPELGAVPTADEMAGKAIEGDTVEQPAPIQVEGPKAKGETTPEQREETPPASNESLADTLAVEGLTDGAKATLRNALRRHGKSEEDLVAAGFPKVDEMPFSRFNDAMAAVKAK
jgi:phage recombination protein Bet